MLQQGKTERIVFHPLTAKSIPSLSVKTYKAQHESFHIIQYFGKHLINLSIFRVSHSQRQKKKNQGAMKLNKFHAE